jgi:tetratricopeptide (TPR) repeat protein
MIPLSPEDRKKEAFRLFEDGRYLESLQQCEGFLKNGRDPAIEILSATNLYSAGRLEDAEAAFRDLAQKMPDSSYVHSYLAKVLEAQGDESAVAEYATAVHLDPDNQDALRSYAGYQISRRDYRSALPVLKRLVQLGKRPGDVRSLMRAQVELGLPGEALATASDFGGDYSRSHEYVDALARTGRHAEAARSAEVVYRETRDIVMLRKFLRSLAEHDPDASFNAYSAHLCETSDCDIQLDFALLQRSSGNYGAALETVRGLLQSSQKPEYRLVECELLAETGDVEKTLVSFGRLIRDELDAGNDMDTLVATIRRYRGFLAAHVPEDEAERQFLTLVSQNVNAISLIETAHFYDERNNAVEARAWYYRAFRADFLAGGLEYARFLSLHGEDRECEKVMLYILSNVKKGADLTKVASVVVNENGKMLKLRRLMDQLIHRLEERRSTLGSEGLELLARSFFIAAANALGEGDFAGCKYYCLYGMDVMPTNTESVNLGDFLQLIMSCKERSVAERPIMHTRPTGERVSAVSPVTAITEQLELSEQEQKITTFLLQHRTATELDLRKLLGTRRVVGIVNRLIRKADTRGMSLIHKKGVGEDGEIYEYTGT